MPSAHFQYSEVRGIYHIAVEASFEDSIDLDSGLRFSDIFNDSVVQESMRPWVGRG